MEWSNDGQDKVQLVQTVDADGMTVYVEKPAHFTNWAQIDRMSAVEFMYAEGDVIDSIDHAKLAAILEEDGGLRVIEGVRFTPGGNFIKALAGNGQVVEVSADLVI